MNTEKMKESRKAYRDKTKQMTLVLSPEKMEEMEKRAERLNLSKSAYLKKLIDEDLENERKEMMQKINEAFKNVNVEKLADSLHETLVKEMIYNPNSENARYLRDAIIPPKIVKELRKKLNEKNS